MSPFLSNAESRPDGGSDVRHYCQTHRHKVRKGRRFGDLKSGEEGFEPPVPISRDTAFPVQKKSADRHLANVTKCPVFKGFVRFSVVSIFVKSRFVKKLVKTWSASWEGHCAAFCQTRALRRPRQEMGCLGPYVVEVILGCHPAGVCALRPVRFAFRHSHGAIELGSAPSSAIEVIAVGRWFFGRSPMLLPKKSRTRGGLSTVIVGGRLGEGGLSGCSVSQ